MTLKNKFKNERNGYEFMGYLRFINKSFYALSGKAYYLKSTDENKLIDRDRTQPARSG
ncbi:MAG: hypothetical protein ACJAYB_003172 [Psychromonas sp.]|jgi:hypothetical protein